MIRNRFSSLHLTISPRPCNRHSSSDAIVIPDILNIDNDEGNGAASRNHVFWNLFRIWALYVREWSGKLPLLLTEMKYCLLIAFPLSFLQNRTRCKEVMVEKSCQQNVCKKPMNILGGIPVPVLNIKKLHQEELNLAQWKWKIISRNICSFNNENLHNWLAHIL